jgi:hypothetical protein
LHLDLPGTYPVEIKRELAARRTMSAHFGNSVPAPRYRIGVPTASDVSTASVAAHADILP